MSDIRVWLADLGLGQYGNAFAENAIEWDLLPDLSDELLEKIGVTAIGHRMKILKAARALPVADSRAVGPPTAAAQTEAERRQLTVMFCDMVGSTNLSESLDPEDLRSLMQAYQRAAGAVVERYQGHVAQYLGDGLMIYFGWPQAHEDDAERAIRASLDIIEAVAAIEGVREPLQVRIGIATGAVVIGDTGDGDASVPKMAVGETPNLAARLQGLAEPGQVIVAPSTYRLAGNAYAFEHLGPQTLKGIVQPVQAWRVTGPGQADSRLVEGLTPYIGRERELSGLDQRLAAVEQGMGQFVLLIGDAGVGKSRLLSEFRARVGGRATWVEGRAISFGQSMAFHPLLDMLRKNFAVEDDDDAAAIRDKVSKGMARVSPDLEAAASMLHYLLGAASDDDAVHQMDPQIRRAETFDTLRQLLLRAAERKPQVMVFEDLHWSDTATNDFLRYILDSVPASRVLILATLRTGYPLPVDERSYVTRYALQNLTSEESNHIAEAVLTSADLPPELRALIHRKAEGNPFFVEELAKSLGETGAIRRDGETWVLGRPIDQSAVPDTIQGVLMSRIDHLAEEPRRTLQLASVIGREFTQRLLDRIDDLRASSSVSLQELQAIELIHQKALYPELAFIFKHALAQDVAYGSLLVQRRKELHRRVAEAIEDIYGDRLEEHYAMIAHHFAAAEDWERAARYYEMAVDHAATGFAVHDAIALGERALAALEVGELGDAPKRAMAIHGKLGNLYTVLSDFEHAHAEHERAAALAKETNETESEGWAVAGMAMASVFGHSFEPALAESERALSAGQAVADDGLMSAAHFMTGFVQSLTGHMSDAGKSFQRSYELSKSAAAPFYHSMSIGLLSQVSNWQGAFDRSVRQAEEALDVATRHHLPFPQLLVLFSLGLPLSGKGEYNRAHAVFSEGLQLSEKLGDEIFRNRFLNCLGWVHAECGDVEGAIALNEQGLVFSQQRGDPETTINAKLNLGDSALAKGDHALANEIFEEAHRLAGNPSTSDWMRWRYSQHLFAGYAETCLARDELAKAEQWTDQCLDLATRTDSKKYLARAWRLKAGLDLARSQSEDAEEALLKALAYAEQIGNPTQLWHTRLALGRLYGDSGRGDQFRAMALAARKGLDHMAASLTVAPLRAAFEKSFVIREAYERTEVD